VLKGLKERQSRSRRRGVKHLSYASVGKATKIKELKKMAERLARRKKIAELKRAVAALKSSYKGMQRKDLEPLQKRLKRLLRKEDQMGR
jgi:2-methylisocitrate lyase-like PEP mutase family enzyme